MQAKGTFEVQFTGEPPYSDADGVSLARATIAKQFAGDLTGDATVQFLGARGTVAGSGAYVALERVTGTLGGRRGSFALYHAGWMRGGQQELAVRVVPDSGTGELAGLSGTLRIDIVDKQHYYTFDYALD